MAHSYFFFRPARLPLTSSELSGETVLPLKDTAAVRASLAQALPGMKWKTAGEGHATIDGMWVEFLLNPITGSVSLRCSQGNDYRAIVQQLCDRLGWLAFDQQPLCYQPGLPPMPA